MAIRLASYLKRNRLGVYYFRRVIPFDLRRFFAFREFERSTGTTTRREANVLARRMGASVDYLFDRLREMAKNKKEEELLRLDYIVTLNFEKDELKSLVVNTTPEEEEAASRLVPQLLSVARGGGVVAFKDSPRLADQVTKYLENLARSGEVSPQSLMDYRGDFDQFLAILGDLRVADLKDHEHVNRLKETLYLLPPNVNKMPETRGKPIADILVLGLPPQAPGTVRKKWARLISFISWLEDEGLIDKNIARAKKPKAKPQSYEKFSNDDLSKLFDTDEYRSGSFQEPFQYWLPLLGLYTGARLEELAQLHLADIKQDLDTQCWFISISEDIDEESGATVAKQLKTDSSVRDCPIHEALVTAGFLTYVDTLRSGGYDRLFPELTPDAMGKLSPKASEWFTEYRRSKGVGESTGRSRKVFHSFRHTLIATLQRAGVALELREALAGHASKSINRRIYGEQSSIAMLRDAMAKLDYGFHVTGFQTNSNHERVRQKGHARQNRPS